MRLMGKARIAVIMPIALLALVANTAPAVGSTTHGVRGGNTAAAVPGAQLWVSHYLGSAQGFNLATSAAASPDRRVVFVTGSSVQLVYATIAYNAAIGAEIWASRLPAGPGNLNLASSLAVGPQGHTVYISGPTTVNSVTGYTTVAYRAASGAQIWLRRHAVNVSFIAMSMIASPSGRTVFVAEDDNGGPAFTDVAYNALTGATEWTVRRGGFGQGSDGITVAVSPDGARVFVAETSDALGSSGGVFVFPYDAATGAR